MVKKEEGEPKARLPRKYLSASTRVSLRATRGPYLIYRTHS